MASLNPHSLITCPYNMAHQIEQYRMQFHLEKCRKQHLKAKKSTCPFNAKHIINEVELNFHVTTCPDREMFDRQKYVLSDTPEFTPAVEAPVISAPAEEDWDEVVYTSYQPAQTVLQKPGVIVKLKGGTPSERRAARMEGVRNYRPS